MTQANDKEMAQGEKVGKYLNELPGTSLHNYVAFVRLQHSQAFSRYYYSIGNESFAFSR